MMSAIGDAVHVLPVVTALKRHEPAATITWILQPGPASLIRGHPDVDEILLFEKARGWRGLLDLRAQLAQRTFDLVIDLQVYIKAGLVTAFTRAPVKLGFDKARARDMNWLFTNRRIPPHAPQHVQDQYLEFLAALDVPAEPHRMEARAVARRESRRASARAAALPRPYATLVIGATHPEKEWLRGAVGRAGERAPQRLRARAGARRRALARASWRRRGASRPLARSTHSTLGVPLRELVAILNGSELVISLDTAPLHMSVALERPVISLMGYNNPKRVGPYRRYHDLIVDAYGDPGEDYPISYAHRTGRMPRISVRDVLEKVERWRSAYRDAAASTRS